MDIPRLVILLGVLLCFTSGACALQPSQRGRWASPVLGKELATELFVPAEDAPGASRRGRAGILYLRNLNAPRIGRESDEAILQDLLREGYVVLAIDYGNADKAVAPHINHDLRILRHQMEPSDKVRSPFHPAAVDRNHTFILPAGYRLARDVPFYEVGGDTFRMDVRYPAKAAKGAAAVIQIPVENTNRMDNKGHWLYNDMIAEGLLTRGYAAVQVDNPLRRYRGIDHMPDVAHKLKAAVRTVRARAKDFDIDGDHIAIMGFSRGSGQAGLTAMSGGIAELEKGPHPKVSSRVQAALLHAGRMDHRALLQHCPQVGRQYLDAWGDPKKNAKVWDAHSAISYVTPDDPPTFLSVGENDWYRVEQIRLMAEALKKAGVTYKHVVTPGLKHQVTGDVKVLGQICDFFDEHLKGKKAGETQPHEAQK